MRKRRLPIGIVLKPLVNLPQGVTDNLPIEVLPPCG